MNIAVPPSHHTAYKLKRTDDARKFLGPLCQLKPRHRGRGRVVGDIYENSVSNDARFVIGTVGNNPLVCFGVNPSTATPALLDSTMRIVSNLVRPPFDSYLMFNLYPQRAKNPDAMHPIYDADLKAENEWHIAKRIAGRPLVIYAAWGDLINKREYLPDMLLDILKIPELRDCSWVTRKRTASGNPHHPLRVSRSEPFAPLDISAYAQSLVRPRPRMSSK
jgi:hypothetical protein